MRRLLCVLVVALTVLGSCPAFAADATVTVDPGTTVTTLAGRGTGLSVNFYVDHDLNRDRPVQTLTSALTTMRPTFLRYPGGGKSQANRWAGNPPNYSTPRAALINATVWPAGTWVTRERWMEFDEFMLVARATGAEPVIVVNQCGYTVGGVTREALIKDAVEWVRYANITRGYGIRYWEIGNEPYNRYYACRISSENYARDAVDFALAMKAVDPTIKVGAGANSATWNSVVLPAVAAHVDWISAHDYPLSWGSWSNGFTTYQNATNLLSATRTVIRSIDTYVPAEHRAKLKDAIIVDEYGPVAFSAFGMGSWADVNDLGHGVFHFDMTGQLLAHPRLLGSINWNTRWVDPTNPPRSYDALDPQNRLNATGLAHQAWGETLLSRMVAATNPSPQLRAFATAGASTANVALINKDTRAKTVDVVVKGSTFTGVAEVWALKGNGKPTDTAVTWGRVGSVSVTAGRATVTLAPLSATVVKGLQVASAPSPDPSPEPTPEPGALSITVTAVQKIVGSLRILWTTSAAATCRITLGAQTRQETAPATEHGVRFDGLPSGVTYTTTITCATATASATTTRLVTTK